MAVYEYGCPEKSHPRITVNHGMKENPEIRCPICKKNMFRIPQPFRFYLNPLEILRDWSEANWSRKKRGEPREEYNVSSKIGLPQKDFDTRRSATK
jgi:hypothetical protein